MNERFDITTLDEKFDNVTRKETGTDLTEKYLVTNSKGDAGEIYYFVNKPHELRIFIDNYPRQKKEFSTSIPFESLKEFQEKLLFLGLELVSEERRSSTNSEIGSSHWFNTLMGRHLHIGELLKKDNHGVDLATQNIWMEDLYETSKELIRGFKFINK